MKMRTALTIAAGGLLVLGACQKAADPPPQPDSGFVISADGTRIAYTRTGSGPAIVLVGGLLSDRKGGGPLAEALASDFTVIAFDRRGHGDSDDTPPYEVAKEIADIAALMELAGDDAALYGHSSGAALALAAAAAGQPMSALVLHEPPFGASDADSRAQSAEIAATTRRLIASGQHEEAIRRFLAYAQVPPPAIEQTLADPAILRMAPSMLHDIEILNMAGGSLLPEGRASAIRVPTLVLVGGEAPPPFRAAGERIAELVDDGRFEILPDQPHVADPKVEGPAIERFLKSLRG
jgi:pimeloyl-ACP methyl ester carboxylesterase